MATTSTPETSSPNLISNSTIPTVTFHPLTSVTSPSLSPPPTLPQARRPSEDPHNIATQLLALADNAVSARQTYFKRFASLYIYNILQYQYEIVALEARLRKGEEAGEGGVKGKTHLELARELRGLLGEYSK